MMPRTHPGTPAETAHRAGLTVLGPADLTSLPQQVRRLDLAVLTGIAAFLDAATSLHSPEPLAPEDAARQAGAAPRHAWILGHWLRALADEGWVTRCDDGAFHSLRRFRRAELVAAREDVDQARRSLGYPAELTRYLLDSLRHLPGLLRDEISAQALLFPDGDLQVAGAAYRHNIINAYLNAAAVESVHRLPRTDAATGRVLELGAGTGSLTADLLPVLARRTTEYLFTDLSPFFLHPARRRFAAHPFVRYETLGLDDDLTARYGAAAFDLVIAVNAAHNTVHAGALLERVAGLLAPGGTLLLIETCHEHHQSLVSMPFLLSARPGAPRTERLDHRAGTSRTYLTRQEWLDAFTTAGLRPLLDLPSPGHPLAAFSQLLLIAQR
ncbi:Methyltransferase domain-containing protein [Thermomonospora echinospora]|uniref:Methyltransferase domain-containing protein n=1 Tax=Thermomonospora echinospora TaxID=1992 RepID=A0A1H6DPB9_9ACTN|nr:methyltransferase [Thermomonospora echinospora]SEG86395.1 Methyltransferase domain-containing protein [Thermomonospora echinospora]